MYYAKDVKSYLGFIILYHTLFHSYFLLIVLLFFVNVSSFSSFTTQSNNDD